MKSRINAAVREAVAAHLQANQEKRFTEAEAAKAIGLSPDVVKRLVQNGILRPDADRLIPKSEIDRYLAGRGPTIQAFAPAPGTEHD